MSGCVAWPETQQRDSAAHPRDSRDELTGNVTQDRGLTHFTEGLSSVYSRMAEALKPGAPLVFTYHHNKLDAYCAVGGGDPGCRARLFGLSSLSR